MRKVYNFEKDGISGFKTISDDDSYVWLCVRQLKNHFGIGDTISGFTVELSDEEVFPNTLTMEYYGDNEYDAWIQGDGWPSAIVMEIDASLAIELEELNLEDDTIYFEFSNFTYV